MPGIGGGLVNIAEEGAQVALRGGVTSVFSGAGMYWLIAIAVAAAMAFGGGYWTATSQAENKLITANQEAYAHGVTAQAKYDAAEFVVAQKDYQKRLAANTKRDGVVAAIEKDLPALVPAVAACTLSSEAMKKLNEVVQ